MNLSEYSVRKPILAIIIIASVSLLGIFSVNQLPLLMLPEFDNPFLLIFVNYRSTSPKEIETNITIPIEGIMGGIKHMKGVTSTSSGNSARIRLEFEIGTDMDLAAMEVRDRLDRIQSKLPEDVRNIRVRRWQTTDIPIYNFAVAWDGPRSELNNIAEQVILPRVLRLDGVADVDIQGIQEKEITVNLNHELMKAYGITVSAINKSLKGSNVNLSGGAIEDGGRRYIVRSIGEFAEIADIPRLAIGTTGIRLGDIGEVSYDYPERTRYQRLDQNDAVSLRVYKSSSANVVEVASKVQEVLDGISSEPGMEKLGVHVFFDQSREIKSSLNNLRNAGIIGGVLAVVILFLFLLKLRSTLIIAMAIPISILCTFTFMFLIRRFTDSNLTLNIISLSGLMLAVGMLVDNSVVVLENIYRYREEGLGSLEAAIRGAKEVGMPVFAATLTTIIVFIPLLFTSQTTFGRFMGDFGLAIVIAMVASMFVALTLIPLIASRLFTGKERGKHRVIRGLISVYRRIVTWTIHHRLITVAVVLAILGGGIFLFTRIEREFVPPTPSRRMDLTVTFPRSFTIDETNEAFDYLETLLSDKKEVLEIKTMSANFSARSGRLTLFFTDVEESKKNTADLYNEVRGLLPQMPGVEIKVGRRWGGGGIDVEFKGPSNEVLAILAEEAKQYVAGVPGIDDVDTSLESGDEEIQVNVDRTKAVNYGLSPYEVAQTISSNLSNTTSSRFKTRDEEIPIKVSLREEDRATLEQLKQVSLDGGDKEIPLGTLTDFNYERGPVSLQRDKGDQIVSVSANTEIRGMRSLQSQIQNTMESFSMPPGYTWQMGSNFRRFQESQDTSLFAIVVALIFIYLVMASLFESFVHPITILFSVPFSIIGVSVLFFLTKTTLNNNSWLGMMVLFGIVVNNGIILIDHINRLRKNGMARAEAIIQGGADRLRPILMTAATTLLGLSPMVAPLIFPGLFGPIEGRAGQYGPIALALVGGLITSTFLTLIITPTIYSLMDDLGRFFKKSLQRV